MIKGIGVNIDTHRISGSFDSFLKELSFFKTLGFDYVEIPVAGLGVMYGGVLVEPMIRAIQNAIADSGMKITVHGSDYVNFRRARREDLEIFTATLEFAARVNAETTVYHCGPIELDSVKTAKTAEIETLKSLSLKAEELGISIAVENTNHLVSEVIQIVEKVNSPFVRPLIDVGHLFISCNYRGESFEKEFRVGLDSCIELHLSDNFGKSKQGFDEIVEKNSMYVFGIGDLHLPLGYGAIPYERIFKYIKDSKFSGIVILEINDMNRFRNDYAACLRTIRDRLEGGSG